MKLGSSSTSERVVLDELLKQSVHAAAHCCPIIMFLFLMDWPSSNVGKLGGTCGFWRVDRCGLMGWVSIWIRSQILALNHKRPVTRVQNYKISD